MSCKVFAEGARVVEVPLKRPKSTAVETGRASVSLPGTRKARRRMYRRLNHCAVPGYAPLCMDTNDPDTVQCAFLKRLMRDVPQFDSNRLTRLKNFVRQFLHKNLHKVKALTFEEWLQSTTYDQARKNELIAAHDELRGGRPTKRQASHIDTFVKSECYPEWKHARMINSRSDAFKVFSGPYFKAIEQQVYELKYFIKHVPVPLRPSVVRDLKKSGRHYYQTDFTAFESHFVPEVMDAVECQLYRWCLADYPEDAEFICSTLCGVNRMKTRTGVKAKITARRMSGDMCTSLGNGFTNLMLAMFICHEKHGKLDGFVEGDDGLFSTSVPLSAQDYEELGFTIKIEEIPDPCEGSFCGMIFSESGEIIRDPRRFLEKFGWTQSFINAGPRIMDELLHAKALSTLYETPQCPIVAAMAHYALSKTRYTNPRFVEDGYHDKLPSEFKIPAFNPSLDTRLLFEKTFGVSVVQQKQIEALLTRGNFSRVSSLLPPGSDVEAYARNYVVCA